MGASSLATPRPVPPQSGIWLETGNAMQRLVEDSEESSRRSCTPGPRAPRYPAAPPQFPQQLNLDMLCTENKNAPGTWVAALRFLYFLAVYASGLGGVYTRIASGLVQRGKSSLGLSS